LEKEKGWEMNTGEMWEGDKHTKANMEENVKEMVISTVIGGL
jgi:hypothetical protein